MLNQKFIRETEQALSHILSHKGKDKKLTSLHQKCLSLVSKLKAAENELSSHKRNPDNPSDWWELNICKSRVIFFEECVDKAFHELRAAITKKEYRHISGGPTKKKPTKKSEKPSIKPPGN